MRICRLSAATIFLAPEGLRIVATGAAPRGERTRGTEWRVEFRPGGAEELASLRSIEDILLVEFDLMDSEHFQEFGLKVHHFVMLGLSSDVLFHPSFLRFEPLFGFYPTGEAP